MTPTSLIVVADRGSLKAYRVEETPTRGPSLKLVQAFALTEARGALSDKVSDQAGGFPVSDGGNGRHMNSAGERTHVAGEADRRTCKQLASEIENILQREKPAGWSLAAPSEIYNHIVEHLPPPRREQIVEHVKADLVKIELAKLPSHFRSLQPL
ncbi:MAG: host attachment protein [Verrucomicrobiota bacterium]|nr:host attachment protein [Verrucomicrobiota bacterium]